MRTSGRPSATRRDAREPPQTRAPVAGDVVLLGAVFNSSYAAVIIYALTNPDTRLSAWVGTWVLFARRILKPAYVLAGRASCGGAEVSDFVARAWIFDVHLLAINLIVVAALFAASRRYWGTWLEAYYGAPRWGTPRPRPGVRKLKPGLEPCSGARSPDFGG